MIKKLLGITLITLLLLSAVGCAAERYDLLYQTTAGDLTYCVRGSGTRAKQLVVKNSDGILWSTSVKVAKSVGDRGGDYGFAAVDLNFDSYPDLMLANAVSGDSVSYLCWLWDKESATYIKSEALSGLCNIETRIELSAIFAFSHTEEYEEEYADAPASTITCDSTTMYRWEGDKLIPDRAVSLTYYSEFDRYCYSVAYYDEQLGALGDPDDRWLTPAEYEASDWSFLYYFK